MKLQCPYCGETFKFSAISFVKSEYKKREMDKTIALPEHCVSEVHKTWTAIDAQIGTSDKTMVDIYLQCKGSGAKVVIL